MPADPHERERFDNKLTEAAEQAKRKAAALSMRPDVIANTLGIDVAEASALTLLPIVVTNQDYGFSTRVNDVLVLEAGFLATYLGAGTIVTDMALNPNSGRFANQTTTIYATEKAAAMNFEREVSAPYVLTRFLDRTAWNATVLPTLVHGATLLEMPVLQDIAGYERMRAEALIAEVPR
jgi:hypothetical protein